MILKYIFDRFVALIGLLFLWPVLLIVAILVKVKMPCQGMPGGQVIDICLNGDMPWGQVNGI